VTREEIRARITALDTWLLVECFHGTDPSPLQLHQDAAAAALQLVLDVVDDLPVEERQARHEQRVTDLEKAYGPECGRETRR
jgi:hypothetical protein